MTTEKTATCSGCGEDRASTAYLTCSVCAEETTASIQSKDAEIARLKADLEVAVRKRPAYFEMEKELDRVTKERDALRAELERLTEKAKQSGATFVRVRNERDALEHELASLKPSGQVAQYVEILSKSIAWSDGCCNRPPCVDQGEDALSRLASQAQAAQVLAATAEDAAYTEAFKIWGDAQRARQVADAVNAAISLVRKP